MGDDMSNAGNSWTPPKGPFTRQGSKLFRGDGQQIGIAMAANEADWMLKQLNAAAPTLRARDAAPIVGERDQFEAWAIGRGLGVTIEREADGEYMDGHIYVMWLAWSARATLPSGGGAREAAQMAAAEIHKRRPLCRDCADHDGTCPYDNLPCNPGARSAAIIEKHIPSAPAGLTEEERGTLRWVETYCADGGDGAMALSKVRQLLAIINRLTGGQKS